MASATTSHSRAARTGTGCPASPALCTAPWRTPSIPEYAPYGAGRTRDQQPRFLASQLLTAALPLRRQRQ
eukprot:16434559-Heterocapsa_arctica.AAC.1